MTPLQHIQMRRLLCGIPAFILATALLPASASAQTQQVGSEGRVTLTTVQRALGAGVTARSLAPQATIAHYSLDDADVRVNANTLAANATANAADAQLRSDAAVPPLGGSRAAIQADAVDAEGAILILSRQAMSRSPVLAETARTAAQFRGVFVANSQIALEANSELANARGNDHVASLTSNGDAGGIALLQTVDTSQVRAAQSGITALCAGRASDSNLTVSANRHQANAVANATDATVRASGTVAVSANGVPTTAVDGAGTAIANAAEFVAQMQTMAGPTAAAAGNNVAPSGSLLYADIASGSTLAVNGNSIGANATANDAAGALFVNVAPVARSGNLAAALTAQRLDGAVLGAVTGRAQIHVAGGVSASALEASNNDVRASASGNVADTVLEVDAPALATRGLQTGPVGTALVSGDETRSTSAALAAHSDQRIEHTAISANAIGSGVAIETDGSLTASNVVATDNRQSALASGNGSATRVSLKVPAFASTADLLLSQTSEADISAVAGDPADPAGVTIAPSAPVSDTQLRIADNSVRTLVTANRADNLLALETAVSVDGGGHVAGRAGTLEDGYGASATLALSSVQKIGMLGAQPTLFSNANGRFAVSGNGPVSGSSVAIQGNFQSATAVANTSDNVLNLSGSALGDTSAALSSSQYGAANVFATSSARMVAPGTARNSTVAIAGNSNQATASLNEATNSLTVHSADRVDGPPTSVGGDTLGGADSQGTAILNNAQFATGRADATSRTVLAGSTSTASPGLYDGSFRIEGNDLAAEASGNRASNSVSLRNAPGGIASSQMNVAAIGAATQTDTYLGQPIPGQGLENASLTIDGNRIAALARGNLAENDLRLDGLPDAEVALSEVGSYRTLAIAPTAIASSQSNYGGVTAEVSGSGFSVPLNGTLAQIARSGGSISGNSTSATAYANGAINTVTMPSAGVSGVALTSSQYNYGAVVARVSANAPTLSATDVRGTTLSISNNSVVATATGNVVTNLMGTAR